MDKFDKVYISIATYNEQRNIKKLLPAIYSLNIPNLYVVVVDDNSPDGTSAIVKGIAKKYKTLNLITRCDKSGYGSAHVCGFQHALSRGAQIIISMDADFSHNPDVIPRMIVEIKKGYDVVLGSRRVPGGRIVGWGVVRTFFSRSAMMFSRAMLGITTRDVTTGFRAYTNRALQQLELNSIQSNGYAFLEELLYYCEKNKFSIKEIPIIFVDRQCGKSKLSFLEIIKFFITIFRLKLRK